MWVGNVPSDATQEEVWNFFSSRSFSGVLNDDGSPLLGPGVESIHLIARSNCAFVNYIGKIHVEHAVSVSHGIPLRPHDKKVKPLVCRVRGSEDDAKSGVGGQRGEGVHRKYVQMLRDNTRLRSLGVLEDWEGGPSALLEADDEKSWSDASSNSSLFEEFFPKRFFILKAHNNAVLDDSVRSGYWRTQSHNEHTLNQAYRTAKDGVWIVFSANKSGEWYGYALMTGMIPQPGTSPSINPSQAPSPDLSLGSFHMEAAVEQDRPPVEQLGNPFPIRWIELTKVPFSKTRLLSNSFNMGREVKICRDGTEIEPETGELLLQKFQVSPQPALSTSVSTTLLGPPGGDRRGNKFTSGFRPCSRVKDQSKRPATSLNMSSATSLPSSDSGETQRPDDTNSSLLSPALSHDYPTTNRLTPPPPSSSRLFPIRSVKYPSGPPPNSPPLSSAGATQAHGFALSSEGEHLDSLRIPDKTTPGSRVAEPPDQIEDSGTGESQGQSEALLMTSRFEHTTTEDGGNWVLTGREGQLERCEDEPIHAPGAVQAFGVIVCVDEEPNGNLTVQQVSENSKSILGISPSALLKSNSFLDFFHPDSVEDIREGFQTLAERDNDPSNTDRSPIYFKFPVKYSNDTPPILTHCAIHSPDRMRIPHRRVLEFELVADELHPLSDKIDQNEFTPREKGGMRVEEGEEDAVYDEEALARSTIGSAKPLRELARWRRNGGDMDVIAILTGINRQLDQAMDLDSFLKITVGIFKEITEFDRVMVYQFDENFNGQVVAELVDWSRTKDLFRGLNFPAADIPAQARDLYKINKVRLLYDRDEPTARLCCRSLEEVETPLDMTHCHLRSMSPIHLKYLYNMGVRSSMSISITAFGDLWGLVSLHGYGSTGHRVSFPLRQLCKLLGENISKNIERLSYARRLQARKLINTMPTAANPSGYIVAQAEDLLDLFDADFGVLGIGEEAKIIGPVQNSQELLAVLSYLRTKRIDNIVTTEDLTTDFPDIDYSGTFDLIAGFLVVPLSSEGKDFIVFFRKGQLKEVHWAGVPNHKLGDFKPLEPRKSFKTWSEIVVGKCRAWTDEEVETAGVLCLVYGKFIDVWRQKESAVAASQLTNLLLANASHEVRTPLNAIINYLELALEGPVDGEVRENLAKSYEASRSLIHVINDLLDLTRTEHGNDLFLSDPFNLPATLADAISLHKAEAERRGLTLDIVESPSGTPPVLLGDRGKVKQVIANIVSNAVKHTDVGGVVVEWGELVDLDVEDAVENRQDSIRIGISVIDTGCGLSNERLESIFRELEEVSTIGPQSPVSTGGTGLGLAVCARIVRKLDGQLRVESTVDQGSKFTIVLPFRLPSSDVVEDSALLSTTPPYTSVDLQTVSETGSAEISRISTPKFVRQSSYESSSSLNSKGSKGSSKGSEIDSLINAMSTSHMDPSHQRSRSNQGALPSSASSSTTSLRHRSSNLAAAARNRTRRAPRPGEMEVMDSGTPLRSVRVPPEFLDKSKTPNPNRRQIELPPSRPSHSMSLQPPSPTSSYSSLSSMELSSSPSTSQSRPIVIPPSPLPPNLETSSQPLRSQSPRHISEYRRSPQLTPLDRPPWTKLKVLVVEDELVNRLILIRRLEKVGHKVVSVSHGGEAVRLMEKDIDGFDLILMDLMMPIMGGYEASAAIRDLERTAPKSRTPRRPSALLYGRVPILAVSASLLERQRDQLISNGLDGWLLKPVVSTRLYSMLEGAVDLSKRSENLYQPGAWERGGWLSAGNVD